MISFIVNTVLWVCEYGAVTMLVLLVSVMIGYLMTQKSHFPSQFRVPDRVGGGKKKQSGHCRTCSRNVGRANQIALCIL